MLLASVRYLEKLAHQAWPKLGLKPYMRCAPLQGPTCSPTILGPKLLLRPTNPLMPKYMAKESSILLGPTRSKIKSYSNIYTHRVLG